MILVLLRYAYGQWVLRRAWRRYCQQADAYLEQHGSPYLHVDVAELLFREAP